MTVRRLLSPAYVLLLATACGGGGDAKPDAKTPAATTAESAESARPPPAAPKLPPVDAEMAAKAVKAIAQADTDMKPVFAARAIADIEVARLGPSLIEGFEAVSQAPPDQRATLIARAISKNVGMLNAACAANGLETMQSLATIAPEQRNDMLWSACKFERHGLISLEEGKAAEATAVILAHMAYVHLKADGPLDPNEKKLLETLMTMKPVSPAG